MKFLSFKTLFLSLFILLSSPASWAFYGLNSAEADLKFNAEIDLSKLKVKSLKELEKKSKLKTQVDELLDLQIQHLMGSLQAESFVETTGYSGTLGATYKIKYLNVMPSHQNRGSTTLMYQFEGKIVFDKRAFRSSKKIQIPIILPRNPETIYSLGFKGDPRDFETYCDENSPDYNPEKSVCLNRCTDEHYNTEGDFWYFWDPEMKGCPLKKDKYNVIRTKGTLERVDNFAYTYPEYDKLFDSNYNDGSLDISIFLGYIDEEEELNSPNPEDFGYMGLEFISSELESRGFEIVNESHAFSVGSHSKKGPNVLRVYEKKHVKLEHSNLPETPVRISILLTDTSINSEDPTFHYYFTEAVKNSEIVIYDGHSGLGANLDIESIDDLELNKSKYQIFFLNGCSSYRYFNYSYFNEKGGSRNLDIVSSGLPTFVDSMGPNVVAFLNYFIDGKPRTYQKVVQDIEHSNGEDNGTYLVSVEGDSDNEWHPPKK